MSVISCRSLFLAFACRLNSARGRTDSLIGGYTHLLTGYIGSVSFIQTLLKVVAKLRELNPELVFVCDPVMGDEGKVGRSNPATRRLSAFSLSQHF